MSGTRRSASCTARSPSAAVPHTVMSSSISRRRTMFSVICWLVSAIRILIMSLDRSALPGYKDKKRSLPLRVRPVAGVETAGLLRETVADVREDVVDLMANDLNDDDDHDRDQDEDERILNHALPLLSLVAQASCERLGAKVERTKHLHLG